MRQASQALAAGWLMRVHTPQAHSSSSFLATFSLALSLQAQPIRLFLTGSLLDESINTTGNMKEMLLDSFGQNVMGNIQAWLSLECSRHLGCVLLYPFKMPTKINTAHLLTQQMEVNKQIPLNQSPQRRTSRRAPPSVSPDRSEHTRKRSDTELQHV